MFIKILYEAPNCNAIYKYFSISIEINNQTSAVVLKLFLFVCFTVTVTKKNIKIIRARNLQFARVIVLDLLDIRGIKNMILRFSQRRRTV